MQLVKGFRRICSASLLSSDGNSQAYLAIYHGCLVVKDESGAKCSKGRRTENPQEHGRPYVLQW
jgi:hypothetical protein